MAWLCRFSIRRPWLTLLITFGVATSIAPQARRLQIRTDGHALVPRNAPEIQIDAELRKEFGFEDPIVVFIQSNHENGIFNPHTLRLIAELTEDCRNLVRGILGLLPDAEVPNVVSLETERGDRTYEGTLRFRTFLDPLPTRPEELKQLRDDLAAIKLYSGTVVSFDGTAAAIFAGVPEGVNRGDFYRSVQEVIAAQGDIPETIQVIGAPVAEALLGTHILDDLGVPEAVLGRRLEAAEAENVHGIPLSLDSLRFWIAGHVGLLPIGLTVMALVFFISLRSLAAVALPMIEVGACLAMVFGLMGWWGVPVYLTIAVLPVILTAIGVTDEIHLFHRYRELLILQPDRPSIEVLTDTVNEMWRPVTKTALTTAVGFASFAFSPIAPVQAFGIFTSIGVILCMVWSFTAIPASLAILPASRIVGRHRGTIDGGIPSRRIFALVGRAVMSHRYLVLVLGIAITIAGVIGARRIIVQDSWIDGFSPASAFYKATEEFNDKFLGTHTLLVCVDVSRDRPLLGEIPGETIEHQTLRFPGNLVADPQKLVGWRVYLRKPSEPVRTDLPPNPRLRFNWDSRIEVAVREGEAIIATTSRKDGSPRWALGNLDQRPYGPIRYELRPEPFMHPATLRLVEALEEFIRGQRELTVGGVLGPASYVITTNFLSQGRKPNSRVLPDKYERAEWLWAQYGGVRGYDRLRQIVNQNYDRGLISVYMKNANFVDTARLMDAIRDYEKQHLAPHGITLQFAGDVAVSQTLIGAIVTTQVRSVLGSLIGVFLVTAGVGRSLAWGAVCTIPCALAVLINFGLMGFVGMPLGVASSMFAGMTLGVGVDHAIHLLERYRLSRTLQPDQPTALIDALASTGPAIFVDALAVALAFGVLILSQVPANARLGALVAVSILNGFAGTVLLVPALLALRFMAGRKNGARE